ncbi:hypothetical protein ANCCAN_20459, partial [Ancylostoma caninum]
LDAYFNPSHKGIAILAAPEPLKARILVLEKELHTTTHFPNTRTVPTNSSFRLPCLKDAWGQPIPSELRVRQEDFLKVLSGMMKQWPTSGFPKIVFLFRVVSRPPFFRG